jgi:hypothetical protein
LPLATGRRSAHIGGMDKPRPKTTLTPSRNKIGGGWRVKIQWEEGPSEQVLGFKTKADAQDWIVHKSAAWLKARGSE